MGLDLSGKDSLIGEGTVSITIEKSHPLILLSNSLEWITLMDLVIVDLQETTAKGFWYLGRKLVVRIHLGAYILQKLYDLTDRKLEYYIKDNAAFQLFCGKQIVRKWNAPDHTKIEEFRNRLSPETVKILANTITQTATKLGFADPSKIDIDSTVQSANITYPSDASLMCKIIGIGKKFIDYITKKQKNIGVKFGIDFKSVKEAARKYFFLAKNKPVEVKRKVFKDLHKLVKQQIKPLVNLCQTLTGEQIKQLPWNMKQAFYQIKEKTWRYILDVAHFTRTHTLKTGKILSFHAKELACIKKGKAGKEFEFGRVFQLGRLAGNFIFVQRSTSIEMNDKKSFIPFLEEYTELFGNEIIANVATDKGYWSRKNQKELLDRKIPIEGFQKPGKRKQKKVNIALQEALQNRRAGIEPLIGHIKKGGQLGKSRMKSDAATLAAGYGSVLGFNLRQTIRWQQGKMKSLS